MPDYKCSIIADPKGASWEFACNVYRQLRRKSEGKGFELNPLERRIFADGEYLTKVQKNVRKRECFYIHDSNLSAGDWYTILCMVNHTLRGSSAQEITDVLPFMRFARQDRKDESRVPTSPSLIADNVKGYADRAITLDVHNPAVGGAFTSIPNPVPFDNLYSFKTAIAYLRRHYPQTLENIVVMSPDAGGAGRATAFAKRLGWEDIAMGRKVRKEAGVVSSLQVIGEVSGKNVFIVDDMIDSGGTIIKAATAVRQKGAKKVYAYATHGLFTRGVDSVAAALDGLFVGDTLKQEKHPKVHVISFAGLFADAIYRIHLGESLSELVE